MICNMYLDVKSLVKKIKLFIKHINERITNHFPNWNKAVGEVGINFVWQSTKMKSALEDVDERFENQLDRFSKWYYT